MIETSLNLSKGNCQENAKFSSLESGTWKWLSVALIFYTFDLILRFKNRRRPSQVIDAQIFPESGVVHLQLLTPTLLLKEQLSFKPNFQATPPQRRSSFPQDRSRPGDYVYIKCPDISILEWHPFSLTSLKTKENQSHLYSFHMQAVGDWSTRFKEKIEDEKRKHALLKANLCQWKICNCNNKRQEKSNNDLPPPSQVKVYVDGPFSSPSQDVFSFRVSCCIAGGIGVTPFISALSFMS